MDVVNCWPTPSNDGTCDVNIEYELENQSIVLHDLLISIPLPCVSSSSPPFSPFPSQTNSTKCICITGTAPTQP